MKTLLCHLAVLTILFVCTEITVNMTVNNIHCEADLSIHNANILQTQTVILDFVCAIRCGQYCSMDCRHCLQETKYELSLFPFMFVAILQVLTYIYVSLYQCVRIIPLSIFHAVHGSFDKKYLRQYLRWHLNLAQQLTYAWHTWSCPFR